MVTRLEALLVKIEAGEATACQIQHPMMKRFVPTLKDGRVKLNATKVRADAKYDGKYVLRTTADLTLPDIVSAYKTLHRLEQGFRTIKSVLQVRPIYHHADHRIISHVKLCVLAYFMVRHVEIQTVQSWEQIARLFAAFTLWNFAPMQEWFSAGRNCPNIHVAGRPDWVFVKVYTHGAQDRNIDASLGPGGYLDNLYSYLESAYNDGSKYSLNYVTAREMYNIIKAAEAGEAGNPGNYRDYVIPTYANRLQ